MRGRCSAGGDAIESSLAKPIMEGVEESAAKLSARCNKLDKRAGL